MLSLITSAPVVYFYIEVDQNLYVGNLAAGNGCILILNEELGAAV